MFNDVVDTADEIFLNMPAPMPSKKKNSTLAFLAAPVRMSDYYNNSTTCFDGNNVINLPNGKTKLVKHIKKGDLIASLNGTARVRCVIKTFCNDGFNMLCKFKNGLIITEWHPIFYEGKWTFPVNVVKPKIMSRDAVYSLVLDQGHVATINGTQVICLGHDL